MFLYGDYGGDFGLETQSIIVSRVREPFDTDNEGPGMQIGRFDRLRNAYVDTAQDLVTEYLSSFRERIATCFDTFENLTWMSSKYLLCVKFYGQCFYTPIFILLANFPCNLKTSLK